MTEVDCENSNEAFLESREQTKAVVSALRKISRAADLTIVVREAETRIKEIAAETLHPGTDELIEDLCLLDLIWNLSGDTTFTWNPDGTQKGLFWAIEYYLGRKVQLVHGTGIIAQMAARGEFGIRVRLKCSHVGCNIRHTVYAKPGCHAGAFCYVYDREGNRLADLRNQQFACTEQH